MRRSLLSLIPSGTSRYRSIQLLKTSPYSRIHHTQLTIIEPGIFRTAAVANVQKLPVPPAYNKPTLSTFVIRGLVNDTSTGADPRKAVKQFYKVASLPDPPIRIAIGQDAIAAIKQQVTKIAEGVDTYASWSEDLGFD